MSKFLEATSKRPRRRRAEMATAITAYLRTTFLVISKADLRDSHDILPALRATLQLEVHIYPLNRQPVVATPMSMQMSAKAKLNAMWTEPIKKPRAAMWTAGRGERGKRLSGGVSL